MDKYEVLFRDKDTDNRWSAPYNALSFGHAEDQANETLRVASLPNDEIIKISKDF